MKTNSKEVREQIKKHILGCVQDENENYFTSIDQAANRLYSEFNRVANHANNMRRYPVDQERFSDYLDGLPFHFHYYHGDIKEFLNSLGINPGNKTFSDEKSHKLYHYLIYSEMMKNKTINL